MYSVSVTKYPPLTSTSSSSSADYIIALIADNGTGNEPFNSDHWISCQHIPTTILNSITCMMMGIFCCIVLFITSILVRKIIWIIQNYIHCVTYILRSHKLLLFLLLFSHTISSHYPVPIHLFFNLIFISFSENLLLTWCVVIMCGIQMYQSQNQKRKSKWKI